MQRGRATLQLSASLTIEKPLKECVWLLHLATKTLGSTRVVGAMSSHLSMTLEEAVLLLLEERPLSQSHCCTIVELLSSHRPRR